MSRLSMLALLATTGCSTQTTAAPPPGEIPSGGVALATVNGHAVTQEMVDQTLASLPDQIRVQLEQAGQVQQVTEQVITGEALYRKAIEASIHEDPKVQLAVAMSARNALADALIGREVEAQLTEEAIQGWYNDHKVQFSQPQVHPRVIVVEDQNTADSVMAEINGGGDFGSLAKTHSKDPTTGPNGGDLGWLGSTDMKGPFGSAVFAAKTGDTVGPLDAGGAFLIFRIEEKRDSTPLDDVRDEVRSRLSQELTEAYIKSARESAVVTYTAAPEEQAG